MYRTKDSEETIGSNESSFSRFSFKRLFKSKTWKEKDSEGTQTASRTRLSREMTCKKVQKGTPTSYRSTRLHNAVSPGNPKIQYVVASQFGGQYDQYHLTTPPRPPPPASIGKSESSGIFGRMHKALAPNSSEPASKVVLADKPKSKFRGCCKICRRKKKKKELTEEEKKTLRETDLSSMFVPLPKSSGTSAAMKTKSGRPGTSGHEISSQASSTEVTERQLVLYKPPVTYGKGGAVNKAPASQGSTTTVTKRRPKKGKGRHEINSSQSSMEVTERALVPYTGPSTTSGASGNLKPSLNKTCCYMCVQYNMGMLDPKSSMGTTSHNKSVQIGTMESGRQSEKVDKSCNPIPHVRTIRTSANVTNRDTYTQMCAQPGKPLCLKKKVKPLCPGRCTLPKDTKKYKCG